MLPHVNGIRKMPINMRWAIHTQIVWNTYMWHDQVSLIGRHKGR